MMTDDEYIAAIARLRDKALKAQAERKPVAHIHERAKMITTEMLRRYVAARDEERAECYRRMSG